MTKTRPKPTILDHIESVLARAAGYAAWPFTDAILESEINVNSSNAQAKSSGASFSFFTYHVDGRSYTVVVRKLFPPPFYLRLHKPVTKSRIQYNPKRPERFYYAPACHLASHFIGALGIVGLVIFTVAIHLT